MPAFPALIMLAAFGYSYFVYWLAPKVRPYVLRFALPILLLVQAAFVLPSYPYYFSYYNPLAGGGALAVRTIQVGWGEGLNEAAAYLNTLPGAESLRAVAWYSTTFEPYFVGQTIYKIEEEKISRSAKPGLAADVVIFYVNQVQRRLPSDGGLAYFQREAPLHTIRLAGQPYAWIYAAPGVAHIIGGESRLVGQAELLGFDLLDEKERKLRAAPSGGVTTLRLYWEWQGKSPDEPIQASLVNDEGETWGWAHLLASSCPAGEGACNQEGGVMVNEYALAVQPGAPPGSYYLRAWIDRPATGEVVGQFPLAPADALVTVSRPETPARPEDFEITHAQQAAFGPLRLLGYNLADEAWETGEQRRLELFWFLPAAVPQPETTGQATAHLALVPATASAVPHWAGPTWQREVTPAYPPSAWQAGDLFRDVWRLDLPHSTPKGSYDLQLTVSGVTRVIGRVEVAGRERLFEPPFISTRLQATVGNSIELLGYTLENDARPNASTLQITLFWQAVRNPAEDYTVFVQLLDHNQQVVVQQDSQPQAGAAPTSAWAAGEIVPDTYTLSFPPPAPGESYRLIAGMYRPQTGERLPLLTEAGETDSLTLAVVGADE